MSGQPTADALFSTWLHELYEAAGSPDLANLGRQGKSQKPPVELSDATLSDWFNGTSIPSKAKERELRFLVEFLEGRAGQRSAAYVRRGADRWQRLCENARQARRNRDGTVRAAARSGAGAVARSAYLEQIRQQVAPPALVDREVELAELAVFCRDTGRGPYVWWQAGPWAGKTALLSTFVAYPPREFTGRVWLVAFFITARLAGQDTRAAFTEVVTGQLCRLLGEDPPAGLSEATRDAALSDLLTRAAANREQAGGCLVLIVDGLDEDRGVTTGPHTRSIAGLLPGSPPAGMRVIVAGRPDPPIPDDVPDWHPLRDPGIIRLLVNSPYARDLQRLGQTELKRLLKGSPVEQDLLGLLTAARGGLSGPDLRELTGADLVYIEDVLHTVTGRTFARRAATWAPDTGPKVYLLGHEELQRAAEHYLSGRTFVARAGRWQPDATVYVPGHEELQQHATDLLGPDRLEGYRQRIHAWADGYRTRCWPPGTPEYLLRGYHRLLHANADLPRMIACGTDTDRHNRMLDITGGDITGLTEIATTQQAIADQPCPDLAALARLAIHRDHLAARNRCTPGGLPALWVQLGNPIRAEAIARSITDPRERAGELTRLAVAVAEAGDPDRALTLLAEVETIARLLANPDDQARSLAELATTVADLGDIDWAEAIARSIIAPDEQASTLAWLVTAVAGVGDIDRAEAIARSLADTDNIDWAEAIARSPSDPDSQGLALARLAAALALARLAAAAARVGDIDRARTLVVEAEAIARSLTDPGRRTEAFTELAAAAVRAGDPDRARTLVVEAEAIARSLTDPDSQGLALAWLAVAVAEAGDPDRAEVIARSIADPMNQARALTWIVAAVASDPDRTRTLVIETETVARSIADPYRQADALVELAAVTGDPDRARTLVAEPEARARCTAGPNKQALYLTRIAAAMADAGDIDRARALAIEAEAIARTTSDPISRVWTLARLTAAMADAGDIDRAEAIARLLTDPGWQVAALTRIAAAVAEAGDPDRARTLITKAEVIARSFTDSDRRALALAEVARAVPGVGDIEQTRRLTADALQLGSWGECLAAVCRIDPSAIAVIADEYFRTTDHLPTSLP